MREIDWTNIFGDNLAEIMVEQGYTQKELAEASGLSESAISQYLNKKRMPSVKAIINLGYVLDCDFNDFLDFGDRID